MPWGLLRVELFSALIYRTGKSDLWFEMLVKDMLAERLPSQNGRTALLIWHEPQAMHWIVGPRIGALV